MTDCLSSWVPVFSQLIQDTNVAEWPRKTTSMWKPTWLNLLALEINVEGIRGATVSHGFSVPDWEGWRWGSSGTIPFLINLLTETEVKIFSYSALLHTLSFISSQGNLHSVEDHVPDRSSRGAPGSQETQQTARCTVGRTGQTWIQLKCQVLQLLDVWPGVSTSLRHFQSLL